MRCLRRKSVGSLENNTYTEALFNQEREMSQLIFPGVVGSSHRKLCALVMAVAMMLIAGCSHMTTQSEAQLASLREQVRATEIAFAKTMADRDHAAFSSFIASDAVFLNLGNPLRGKPAVTDFWQRFFKGTQAPFSWKPEAVEVLLTGQLAESSGPVFSHDGKSIAHFRSTWRRETDGSWKIVLDNGYVACDCKKP